MPEKTLDSRVVRTVRQLRSNSAYRQTNPGIPRPFRTSDNRVRADIANKENIALSAHSRPSSSTGRQAARQAYYHTYAQEEGMDDSQHSFQHRLGSKFMGAGPSYFKQELPMFEEIVSSSNKVKEMELALIENYSQKCQDIMNTSMLVKECLGECELETITSFLFQEKHFLNCLGCELRKRPTKAKLEKFLAKHTNRVVQEAVLDRKADQIFESLSSACLKRMQSLQELRDKFQQDS